MKNGQTKIGLFEGMFETNMISFNPPDVRRVQKALKGKGYLPENEAKGETGPAHMSIKDPDGNILFFDQA